MNNSALRGVANPPSRRERIVFALLVACFAALNVGFRYRQFEHSDFGVLWFGARALLSDRNPYELIGPGLEFDYPWRLIYPLPAIIAVMPLAVFTEHVAATLFVMASAAALAYGMTRNGWHLVPLLLTEAFLSACRLGQMSLILTAAMFFPVLGLLAIVKPQSSLPILAASTRPKMFVYAIAGSIILVAASFFFQPNWIEPWMANLRQSSPLRPPVATLGGAAILLVLLRWRRPEAWLIATLACVPQTVGWYGALPIFTIPSSVKESVLLAGTCALGVYIGGLLLPDSVSMAGLFEWSSMVVVISIYVPAVIMVLRRPNAGEFPAWVGYLLKNVTRSKYDA